MDCTSAEFLTVEEGLCVQMMHFGPFDDEPASVAIMDEFIAANGYENDFESGRLHHEIYMSDARKVAPEKWKTKMASTKEYLNFYWNSSRTWRRLHIAP